jgi:transducin (beta)-like 1
LNRSKEGWVHIWDIDPTPLDANTIAPRPAATIRVGDRNVPEDGQEVTCMEWSRDGNLLAIGTNDPNVRVWSRTTGKLILNLQEHSGTITSVRFSANGKLLLSASLDGSILLWDIEKQILQQKFQSGHSMVICLDCSTC